MLLQKLHTFGLVNACTLWLMIHGLVNREHGDVWLDPNPNPHQTIPWPTYIFIFGHSATD